MSCLSAAFPRVWQVWDKCAVSACAKARRSVCMLHMVGVQCTAALDHTSMAQGPETATHRQHDAHLLCDHLQRCTAALCTGFLGAELLEKRMQVWQVCARDLPPATA